MRQARHLQDARRLAPLDGLPERAMGTDVGDAEMLRGQHHGHFFGAGLDGEDLGVAVVIVARQPQRLLVQRGGHHRVHLPGQRQVDGPVHRLVGRLARAGLHLAPGQCGEVHIVEVQHVQHARLVAGLSHLADGAHAARLADDLKRSRQRGRIAHADDPGELVNDPGRGHLGDNLGAAARRIAHGHRQDRSSLNAHALSPSRLGNDP